MKNAQKTVSVPVETVANWLGLSGRMVARLSTENALPRIVDGSMPTIETLLAYIKHIRSQNETGSQRARLVAAQADSAEIQLAKLRGELVELDDVSLHMENIFNLTRNEILGSGMMPVEKSDLILTLQKLVIQSAHDLNKTISPNSGRENKGVV